MNIQYNPWPCGKLTEEQQRQEPNEIKSLGYDWQDPRDIVKTFETKVATFAGAKYGVAVDCCSHGLFLCLEYYKWLVGQERQEISDTITIPSRTYMSVPMQIKHAGFKVKFRDQNWSGCYRLAPYPIYDAATRWTANMFSDLKDILAMQVVSFQIKKRVPIGRGGMILLDDYHAYQWLCKARYDGRNLDGDYMDDEPTFMGWHYYMTPEDAARGIKLIDELPQQSYPDSGGSNNYSDLSTMKIFT